MNSNAIGLHSEHIISQTIYCTQTRYNREYMVNVQ